MKKLAVGFQVLVLGVAAMSAVGCAGAVKNMQPVANVNTVAAPTEAVVVFLRPSGVGYAVQTSVFEVNEGVPSRLVGIVAAKKKVVYRTTPGPHTFMVIGESADFMYADLAPGRTYYALATVRPGFWKARFSLKPVTPAEHGDLTGWLADSEWVAVNADSERWAAENAADIEKKRSAYLAKWLQKPEADRPFLRATDAQ
jgi:hypothetical protein